MSKIVRWLSKRFRKDLLSSQSGLTPQQTILIILACTFITLVIVLAGFALSRVEEKIKTDVGKALQIVLANHPGVTEFVDRIQQV